MEALEAEMHRAAKVLRVARARMVEHRTCFGGGVDRDLERRLRDALRQVRYLETVGAASLLLA